MNLPMAGVSGGAVSTVDTAQLVTDSHVHRKGPSPRSSAANCSPKERKSYALGRESRKDAVLHLPLLRPAMPPIASAARCARRLPEASCAR